jgi:predicted O-methyltransferase YrrM
LRSWQTWIFLAVGVLAGIAAWLLGPEVTLALAAGAGVAGGLVFGRWFLARQRWVATELTRLRELERRLDTVASRGDLADLERRSRDDLAERLWTLDKRRKSAGRHRLEQQEALHNLYAMLPVAHRMPPLAEVWAVSPDLMLLVVSLVQEHRPATIVELGSGASTAWTALALHEFGIESRMVSVDHDAEFAEVTRERLGALGLEKLVELRHAPLVDLELAGEVYPWYDRAALADIERCDLVLVDGPPGIVRPGARYPALPALAERLGPGSRVLVDDYHRDDEREMVASWLKQYPGWTVREYPLEKGAALLTRT